MNSVLMNILIFVMCLIIGALFYFFPFFKKRKEINLKDYYKQEKARLLVSIILTIGFISRTFLVDIFPGGLNQDEASAGYDAFAILKYGIDRNGISNPIHLVAWGSGQNVLYSYFCMPFIAMFGLNVFSIRLPMGIIGSVSIYLIYRLLKDFYNHKVALIGMVFLIICPWHFMKSRWGLESNLFPDLVFIAFVLMTYGIKKDKSWLLYVASFLFGLSSYSYGTSYFFLFFFVIGALVYLLIKKKITWIKALISVAIVGITSLPIILFIFVNVFDKEGFKFLWMSIPKLNEDRFSAVTNIYSDNFFKTYFENFKDGIKLILNQNDGLVYNNLPNFGALYLISLPFTIFGLVQNKENKTISSLMRIWLLVAVLLTGIVDANVNRINIVYFPLVFFTIIGVVEIIEYKVLIKKTVYAMYLAFFAFFNINYFGTYSSSIEDSFQDSYYKAVQYALSIKDVNNYYVTSHVNMAYIYFLFESECNVNDYLDSVRYFNEGASFEVPLSYYNYTFYLPSNIERGNVYIVSVWDEDYKEMDLSSYSVTNFKYYYVINSK